tara:strand:- start:5 stop:163 length:159 start_codon:yes stop_codon:yes gene_type:complete
MSRPTFPISHLLFLFFKVAIEKIGERLVGVASSRPTLALPSAGELQVALTDP